jgi:NitT/TauT family transport system substrate-binding protein
MQLTPLGRWIATAFAAIALVAVVAVGLTRRNPGNPGRAAVPFTDAGETTGASQPAGCTGLLGRPLRVGIVTWPGYAGGIVANNGFKPNRDSLYFRQYNLCVEFMLMEDVDARAKAFARGGKDGVDVVWSTVDFWANELPGFLKNDLKARAVMQVDWSRGGDAIVADDSVKRIEDLYQKKISLALFTPSHWLLEYNLQSSNLDEDKRNEIVRGLVGKNASPDARADFVAGKVDAAVVWEPDVAEALDKRPNSHVLVSTRDARKLIADLMVAREDFIRDHPDVIRAFVEGWIVDGTVQANREPDTVVRLLMANEPLYRDLGPEVTQKNLATVKWADLADNTEMFNLDGKDPQPLFDRIFSQASKIWVARGYVTAPAAPGGAKDDGFLRKIYKKYPVERIADVFPEPSPAARTQAPLAVKPITVNFAVNHAVLDGAARQVIDDQVGLQPTVFSGANIRVEGNTDNQGDADHNRELSERRAQAVVDYLVERYHLPKNQFIVQGNGPDQPVASNATPEGRAKNRRTDVSVVQRGS